MHQEQRYRALIKGHLTNTLSETEEAELFALLIKPEYQLLLDIDVLEELKMVRESGPFLSDTAAQRISNGIINPKPKKTVWKKWAVAAAVLMMGTAAGLLLRNQQNKTPVVASTNTTPHDIMPGGDKATLTLANGNTIVLDSAADGTLTEENHIRILKLAGGRLAYSAEVNAGPTAFLGYNVLTVPKKGKYQVTLADGSKIWMNAASSLRFPVAFDGNNRTVELTGEAFFEIAEKPSQPFHVKVNGVDIEALGTSFNIMAYQNENLTNTTILSGAVRVSRGDLRTLLSPGQQLQLTPTSSKLLQQADTEQATAWKENSFFFKNAPISAIMRTLDRWYDLDVIYKDDIKELFYARVSRDISLSHVLKALELTGKVHFEIEENKITVHAVK